MEPIKVNDVTALEIERAVNAVAQAEANCKAVIGLVAKALGAPNECVYNIKSKQFELKPEKQDGNATPPTK